MKETIILAAIVLLSCCERKVEQAQLHVTVSKVCYPDHFDQAWVMSSGWFGHMGVAIAISGDRYFYWMYSDIPVEANYPYTGSFRIEDGVLVLGSPSEYTTGVPVEEPERIGLYSDRWRILPGRLSVSIHSITDEADDGARTLIPDFQFDPSNPFRNQQNLKPEESVSPK